MPVRRAEIETRVVNIAMRESYPIPVYHTDRLDKSSIYEIAYSSAAGGYLPYLFVGYFTNGGNFNKWFFANARRHKEMRQAIEQDLGTEYQYSYGQIIFNPRALQNGELLFDMLILHSAPKNRKKAERLLKMAISPEFLDQNFQIALAE